MSHKTPGHMKKEEVGQGVLYCVPNMSARPPRTLNLISSSSALSVEEGGMGGWVGGGGNLWLA